MSISSILVPVDFSVPARRALDVAVEIAKGTGARIELVFAQEVLTYRGVRYEEILSTGAHEKEREHIEESLGEWLAIVKAAGVKCESRIIEGDARHAIPAAASEIGADLIVLGAKGQSRLKDVLLGSVANEVARAAHCSVLVAR